MYVRVLICMLAALIFGEVSIEAGSWEPHPEIQILLDQAKAASLKGETQICQVLLDSSMTRSRVLHDSLGEGKSLDGLSEVYLARGELFQSMRCARQALAIYTVLGAHTEQGEALLSIGFNHLRNSHPDSAYHAFAEALNLFQKSGHRRGEAVTLGSLARFFSDTGKDDSALVYYEKALPATIAEGDTVNWAILLGNVAELQAKKGFFLEALDNTRQALAISRSIEDTEGIGWLLNNLGDIYRQMGQPDSALTCYENALPLLKAAQSYMVGSVLNNLGFLYEDWGDLRRALAYYLEARDVQKQFDRKGLVTTLNNLAGINQLKGDPAQSLLYYEDALAMAQQAKDSYLEAKIWNNIGHVYGLLENYEASRNACQKVITIYVERDCNLSSVTAAVERLGYLSHVWDNDDQKALEWYGKALGYYEKIKAYGNVANVMNSMGAIYAGRGQFETALGYYDEALKRYCALRNLQGQAGVLTNMAHLYWKRERRMEARKCLAQALDYYETIRGALGELTDFKTGLMATALRTYHAYMQLLLKDGETEAAFAWAQKAKGRVLLDLCAQGRMDFSQRLSETERRKERALALAVARLQRQIMEAAADQSTAVDSLEIELAEARNAADAYREQLYALHPDLANKQGAVTIEASELTRWLPDDTALLEYVAMDDDSSSVVLFCAVSNRGQLQLTAHEIPISDSQLRTLVENFHDACASEHGRYALPAKRLYDMLIRPAMDSMRNAQRLVICPDGPLWQVPFAALMEENAFLLEEFDISYGISASVLVTNLGAKSTPVENGVLVVADPAFGTNAYGDLRGFSWYDTLSALPNSRIEALAIAGLFCTSTQVYLGQDAQEEVVKREAGRFRYLHFATHGLLDETYPLYSSIVFAEPDSASVEDGFLTAREIFNLNLSAELTVLSACNTGRGQIKRGEGVVGLMWSVFAAGCPSAIVSLWAVDDRSSAVMMERLYRHLHAGQSKSESLRQAALYVMAQGRKGRVPRWDHPSFWAPFVLVGRW